MEIDRLHGFQTPIVIQACTMLNMQKKKTTQKLRASKDNTTVSVNLSLSG